MDQNVICLDFWLEGKGVRKLGVATTGIIFLLCYSSLFVFTRDKTSAFLIWGHNVCPDFKRSKSIIAESHDSLTCQLFGWLEKVLKFLFSEILLVGDVTSTVTMKKIIYI